MVMKIFRLVTVIKKEQNELKFLIKTKQKNQRMVHVLDMCQNRTLNGRVDSRVRGQVIVVRTQMQSFDVFCGIQLGALVLRDKDN